MLGFAQKLFLEKGKKLPFKPAQTKKSWPQLEKLIAKRSTGYVDYALTEFLLRKIENASDEVAAFICYMSLATRAGHSCVQVNATAAIPDPMELLKQSSEEPNLLEATEAIAFKESVLKGTAKLPSTLCTQIESENQAVPTPLCQFENRIYFQRYWQAESTFKQHLKRIQTTPPSLNPDLKKVTEQLTELQKEQKLLTEQSAAILQAGHESLFVLSGGPGTGKTYTAGQLIKTWWNAFSEEQQSKFSIALAAPTGKAATNLQRSLESATKDLILFPKIQAQTLHSLLGIRSNKTTQTLLSYDLILVDECSIIDLQLMAALLSAIKPGARLILLGDRHQLSPVGVGNPFANLNAGVELKTCLRSELKDIINFAEAINTGDTKQALQMLSRVIKRLPIKEQASVRSMQEEIISYALPFFSQSSNQFCILTPLREGPFGVNTLNNLIAQRLHHRSPQQEWVVAPIVITKNDYKMNLFNGEIGLLFRKHQEDVQEGDYALFQERKIPALLLPKYEYSYCLSIHKSQGSEFDHVLLLVPEGSEVFGREVLYTGVTRARKQLTVWGHDDVFHKILKTG